ncbi:hypothetical protein CF319_g4527 [Tilletia indica]|nr:hypothetical protein CF319_g4527 [Tilletia indica]
MVLELTPPWRSEWFLLDADDLHMTLAQFADSWPSCFGSFQHDAPSPGVPQVIITIDGNFTQKRRAKPDYVSRQPFPPRRFLSQQQVKEADSVLHRAKGTGPDQKSCVAKIRAADLSNMSGTTPYEINGLKGAGCRHDIPLGFCDITTLWHSFSPSRAPLNSASFTLESPTTSAAVSPSVKRGPPLLERP